MHGLVNGFVGISGFSGFCCHVSHPTNAGVITHDTQVGGNATGYVVQVELNYSTFRISRITGTDFVCS